MILDLDKRNEKSFFGTEGSGHQKKLWHNIDGVPYLIKFDSKFREAEKEYSASVILHSSSIPCVLYEKSKETLNNQLRNCCICKSYLGSGEGAISLAKITQNIYINRQESSVSYYNKVISSIVNALHISPDVAENYILTTVTVDYLLMNCDRHLNNFEFIEGIDGVWRPAPLFDFGQSFLRRSTSMAMSEYVALERKFKTKPFSTNPERNLINIDYAKMVCSCMLNNIGDINKLPIVDWHKEVLKRRSDKLLHL